MSHCRFTPIFFTRPAYRRDRCALVLVMPARPRIAISGILAGGSRVSALRLFCLAPVGSSGDVFGFVLLLLQWMTCSGRGTQAAWSLRVTIHFMMLSFHCFLCLWFLFVCCFCLFWLVAVLVCFFFPFLLRFFLWNDIILLGTTNHEAVTVSASLAVINTASKHLHNDLARAIEALEHKNIVSVPTLPALVA